MANGSVTMLVIGDSVNWGQGLPTAHKFHAIVKQAMTGTDPSQDCLMLAHSGATIDAISAVAKPSVHGEVPKFYPTITDQCDAAVEAMPDASLILVNGGINDVDVRFVLNSFTDHRELVQRTWRHCHIGMKRLLDRVLANFPKGRVVLTGYYPILSEDSRLPLLSHFLLTLGVPIDPAFRLFESALGEIAPASLVLQKLVVNCRIFYEESTAALRRAVEEAGGRASRLRLAVAPFTARNAALASEPWLFGINADFSPQDPVATERRQACRLFEKDPLQREQCYRASAGHPNPDGARHFARAILEALDSP